MYTVYADRALLYHPRMINDGYAIYNPTLIIEDNKTGTFQFSMPVTNVLYNSLKKMKTIIAVYDDTELIFRGRILNDERDFNNNKLVYCEGELAFLLDSVARPFDFSGTLSELFAQIVSIHNSQVDEDKQFEVGDCDVLAPDTIKYSFTDYNNCWTLINSYLIDVYGGHIRVSYKNNHRYLDYITTYGSTSTQNVVFGTNLLDITQYISAENVFTRLIPLGATYDYQLDDTEITTGVIKEAETEPVKNKAGSSASEFVFKMVVTLNSQNKEQKKSNVKIDYYIKASTGSASWSGLDGNKIYADIKLSGKDIKKVGLSSFSITSDYKLLASYTGDVDTGNMTITGEFVNQYTSQDNKPISTSMAVVVNTYQGKYLKYTIASVNGGKDYIEDTAAIELFGQINRVQEFPDIEDPSELLTKAREYLAENIVMSVTLEVNAVDLGLLNVDYDKFKMGDRVRVLSHPHNLDSYFSLTKVQLNLQNPESNVYSFGRAETTITETQVNTQNHINLTADQIATIVNDVNYQYTVTEQVSALVEQVYDHYADIQTVIDNLSVTYADIDFANIGTASVKNLFADKAVLTEAEIAALQAESASISQILAKGLTANTAFIENLTSSNAFITDLTANNAFIEDLTTNHLDAEYLHADQANFDTLFANKAFVGALDTAVANIGTLAADSAFVNFLSGKYANIDLLNVSNANAANLVVHSGMVTNATIKEGFVTGELNAVTINGDLINANTLKANRLLVQGPNGLYYRLNLTHKDNGDITTAQWNALTDDQKNSYLHGTNLIAKSVTADQIAAGTITANELSVGITGDNYDGSTSLMSLKTGLGEVTTTVNNWRVGGRNLLRNSRLYKSPLADIEGAEHPKAWGANGGTTFLDYVEGEATRVVNFPTVTANTWREIESYPKMLYSRIRNQTVTVSCEVWAESGANCGMNFCLFLCNSEEDSRKKYRNYYKYFTGTGDWQKIYVTLDITDAWFAAGTDITVGYDSAYFGLRPGAINSKWTGYKARCFMVELGNTPTDWTQAPEDGEESTNTIIDQRKDEIVLAAHSYTKIGGKNLLTKTTSEWSDWFTPNANTGGTGGHQTWYSHDCYDLSAFKAGNQLSISFDLETSGAQAGTGGESHIYFQSNIVPESGSSIWNTIPFPTETKLILPIADGVQHCFYTVDIPSGKDYTNGYLRFGTSFRTDYWNGTGKFRIRCLKLTVGNTDTSWSPAPEDNQAYADGQYSTLNQAVQNIWSNEISSKVSKVLTDGKYQTATDVNKALSGYAKTTDIKQTAESVVISVINGEVAGATLDDGTSYLDAIKSGANADELLKNQYNAYFNFSTEGLRISKTGSPYYALYTESDLQFKHSDTILGRFGTEGLSTTELQIGNMTTAQNRWRIIVNSDGTHLRITRHQ